MKVKPMLAKPAKDEYAALRDVDCLTEVKYDGHRMIMEISGSGVRMWSRLGTDRSEDAGVFQRLSDRGRRVVLDGELMSPDGTSSGVARKDHQDRLYFVAFDMLEWQDHSDFYLEPFAHRRACLQEVVRSFGSPRVRASWLEADGVALFKQVADSGGEGVIVKRKDAPYEPGKRSWAWQKVKCWQTWDVVVTGCDAEPTQWTVRPGNWGTDGIFYPHGKPSSTKLAGYVGLTYGWYMAGELVTVGKLGYTGPKEEMEVHVGKVAEVKAYGCYATGALRHPGVLRFRDDKAPEECVFSEDSATLAVKGE